MSDYKRFVSYLYEYIAEKKENNRGFAKIELRSGICSMQFQLKVFSLPEQTPITIYGYIYTSGALTGYPLGQIHSGKNGIGGLIKIPARIAGTAYNVLDFNGLVLIEPSGKFYGSQWDDNPIIPANFRPAPDNMMDERNPDSNPVTNTSNSVEMDSQNTAEIEEIEPLEVSASDEIMTQEASNSNAARTQKASNSDADRTQKASNSDAVITQEASSSDAARTQKASNSDAARTQKASNSNAFRTQEVSKTDAARTQKASNSNAFRTQEVSKTEAARTQKASNSNAFRTQKVSNSDAIKAQETSGPDETMKQKASAPVETTENPGNAENEVPYTLPPETQHSAQPQLHQQSAQESAVSQQSMDSATMERSTRSDTWEGIRKRYPPLHPFDDDEIYDCIRITIRDFSDFRKHGFPLGCNQFIHHGFQNHQHLLLGRLNNSNMAEYVLGVPGVYNANEQFMASMYGFNHFKPGHLKEGPYNGRSGYWYRPLK